MSSKGNSSVNAESSAFFANNDAASYNTRYLRSIRNKERFQELHFYQCAIDLINELFPKKPNKGTSDPPPSYRASAAALHEWRDLDQAEQNSFLERQQKEATVEGIPKVAGVETAELKRPLDTVQQGIAPAPVAKVSKPNAVAPHVAISTTSGSSSGGSLSSDLPYSWDPFNTEINLDFMTNRTCRGITFDFLKRTFPTEEAKIQGFAILTGDAMNYKAHAYSNNHSWPFASDPSVVGAIVEQMNTDNAKVIIVLKWVCVLLAEPTDEGKSPILNNNKIGSIHFHHPQCDRSSTDSICEKCKLHGVNFVNSCGAAVHKNTTLPTGM